MFISIILPILMREWKYVAIIGLLGGLYLLIYQHGYIACESAINAATAKVTQMEQQTALSEQKRLQIIANDMLIKEQTNSKNLQEQLNAERKKPHVICPVTSDRVRLYNKID